MGETVEPVGFLPVAVWEDRSGINQLGLIRRRVPPLRGW